MVVGADAKNQLSKFGHVAYQIKDNEAYKSMLANILPLHTPSTPGVGVKMSFFFFSESSQVHIIS